MSAQHRFDVLILGSGAAGLATALALPEHLSVALLSKGPLAAGATSWAQGGIAAVLDGDDHLDNHIQDTLAAGAGLCHPDIVRQVVEGGPGAIEWLAARGVAFDQEKSADGAPRYHLTQEGGHGHRRIVHAADATGRAVEDSLLAEAQRRPRLTVFEDHLAVDLLIREKLNLPGSGCVGAYVLNTLTEQVETFQATHTVLATGGASKVYLYTSNPDGATGDGIAMGWRGGCRVANMEFNQFHPTCLYHPDSKSFLMTEALEIIYLATPVKSIKVTVLAKEVPFIISIISFPYAGNDCLIAIGIWIL